MRPVHLMGDLFKLDRYNASFVSLPNSIITV